MFILANETMKPVFDTILEATGENGRSRGKLFHVFNYTVKTGFMLQTVKFRYSREKLHNRAQYRNM